MEAAGFSDITFEDKTEDWATFTSGRYEIFKSNEVDRVSVLGKQTYEALGLFYSSVAKLFQQGRLGGTVITGVFKGVTDMDTNCDANKEL
jgi:hypothetical protein